MELSSPGIKEVLIFSQKKLSLYFGKQNFLKNFQARKISKKHSEKISYISGSRIF